MSELQGSLPPMCIDADTSLFEVGLKQAKESLKRMQQDVKDGLLLGKPFEGGNISEHRCLWFAVQHPEALADYVYPSPPWKR